MDQVTLHIENSSGRQDYELGQEVTIGRTNASTLVLSDSGLSRRNTTIFRDGDTVLVVDENSLNGTILNGSKITGAAQELRDGDVLRIGSDTSIRISIGAATSQPSIQQPITTVERSNVAPVTANISQSSGPVASEPKRLPLIPIAAGLMIFAIIFLAIVAYFVATRYRCSPAQRQVNLCRPSRLRQRYRCGSSTRSAGKTKMISTT